MTQTAYKKLKLLLLFKSTKVKFVRSFAGPQLCLRLNGLFKVTTLFRCFEVLKLPRMCTFRTFKNFAQKINYWKLKLLFLEVAYQKECFGREKEKRFFFTNAHQ